MVKIISVKFRRSGRNYYFDPGEEDIRTGDGVIVETARGEEYGDVTEGVREVDESRIPAALKPIVRVATEEDTRMRKQYIAKESDAFLLCQEKIFEHKLDMKLADVEYTYNGSKAVFYFTADDRVDFRDLVKDLAYQLHTRIELRQIGVRDEAKMLGGLGPCGRPVCCHAFLDDFSPVSIKMAKEQNLSLSPTKISGLCSRLMCCLQYEEYAYEEAHRRLPRAGREVETPEGVGTVTECNVLKETVKVRLGAPDGSFEIKEYPYALLKNAGAKANLEEAPQPPERNETAQEAGEAPAATAKQGGEAAAAAAKPHRERPPRQKQRHESTAVTEKKEAGEKDSERKEHFRKDFSRKDTARQESAPKEAGNAGQETRSERKHTDGERPQGHHFGERKTRQPVKPQKDGEKTAVKNAEEKVTRLPGETIGGGKPAAAAGTATEALHSFAPKKSGTHRHSFGPAKPRA